MASRVTLHVRIVRPDGTRTYAAPVYAAPVYAAPVYAAPVYAANRRLRGGYALVNRKPEHHAEACYYLRYPVEGQARLAERGLESFGRPERPGRPGAPDQGHGPRHRQRRAACGGSPRTGLEAPRGGRRRTHSLEGRRPRVPARDRVPQE
jgi:hypothetical protein